MKYRKSLYSITNFNRTTIHSPYIKTEYKVGFLKNLTTHYIGKHHSRLSRHIKRTSVNYELKTNEHVYKCYYNPNPDKYMYVQKQFNCDILYTNVYKK